MNNNNMLSESVKSLLEDKLGVPILNILPLKGDASYRSYYRLVVSTDNLTYILMKWNPELTNKSEEASKTLLAKEFPFINICNYLKLIDLPVPQIIYHDVEKGIIVLEDLGDITLERLFNDKKDLTLYEKAIKLLALMKFKTISNPDKSCIAFIRKFDFDLYMWEFDHFIEYGIESRNNLKMPDNDKAVLRNHFSDISKSLELVSDTFTHRDYQSRNLMIKDGRFYIIDFQDALISTAAYDLVALLRDSYIRFDDKIINNFIELYVNELNLLGIETDFNTFSRLFYLQTIQRKLKDGGRFIFIDRVKKNPSFLPYIPNSFRYAAKSLKKFSEYAELYKILSKYVPEFQQ